MGDGKTSGSGSSSPFGNGKGGVGAGGPKAGVDFVKNPAGQGGPSTGHNFVKDGQSPPGSGVGNGTVNAAKTAEGMTQPEGTLRCPDSIPQGGIYPFDQVDNSARSPQRDLGTVAQGAPAHKPFRVSSR
jgi:hypothetical protein